MIRLVGLSGSLRRASFNTSLLRAAAALAPEGVEFEVRTLHGVPLFDEDAEKASGLPAAVQELKEAVASAAGLLLATPEYNGSVPGVLKNGLDWMTRPPGDAKRVFGGKAVALLGATPGGLGTILAQTACLPVLRNLGARPWFEGRLTVSRAHELFTPEGELRDEALREQLRTFLRGFASFASPPAR
jgi:chromate reductase